MSAVTFDTLGYFEQLTSAGVPETQAKVQVAVFNTHVDKVNAAMLKHDAEARQGLATKGYLQDLEIRLLQEISKVHSEIAAVKVDTIKWMVGLMFAQVGLLSGAIMLAFRLFMK